MPTSRTVCLAGCFNIDSHWRDVLALSWNIQTRKAPRYPEGAEDLAPPAAPRGFRSIPTAGRHARGCATRTPCDRGDLKFETAVGRGSVHPPVWSGWRRRAIPPP